ncbi:MAG: histone deacetylase family protein [Candidatus Latescibacterota bacterium]
MRIVCSQDHRLHAPPSEYTRRGVTPYSESPERVDAILRALAEAGMSEVAPPAALAEADLLAVHDAGYLAFLAQAYPAWVAAGEPEEAVVAVVFGMRRRARAPRSVSEQVGYYAYDTTPLVRRTHQAARAAAACALTAADQLVQGTPAVYALCRPPGHHAGRDTFGGYCYLNNAAAAAAKLANHGRVALVDVDYHHGNGTQEIFYHSDRVLFVSLHADPDDEYPFFWGRADERGEGAGLGHNRNLPLPRGTGQTAYLEALDAGLAQVRAFAPDWLVVSLGVDALASDPVGTFDLPAEAFSRIGERLAGLRLPSLLVQEGGYDVERLGHAVARVLAAFD